VTGATAYLLFYRRRDLSRDVWGGGREGDRGWGRGRDKEPVSESAAVKGSSSPSLCASAISTGRQDTQISDMRSSEQLVSISNNNVSHVTTTSTDGVERERGRRGYTEDGVERERGRRGYTEEEFERLMLASRPPTDLTSSVLGAAVSIGMDLRKETGCRIS